MQNYEVAISTMYHAINSNVPDDRRFTCKITIHADVENVFYCIMVMNHKDDLLAQVPYNLDGAMGIIVDYYCIEDVTTILITIHSKGHCIKRLVHKGIKNFVHVLVLH